MRLGGHPDGRQRAPIDTPNIKGDKTLTSIYLIDAYAMIYRAYFAFLRAPKINTNGINTSPIYGFISSFTDLVLKRRPDYVAVAFDLHGPTFRHDLYPAYKANRDAQPEDISKAIPYIHRFMQAMNITEAQCERYEADDVVGTLAARFAGEDRQVTMVTPDKDYAQLVRQGISMLRPQTGGEPLMLDEKGVCEYFGIKRPDQVIDMLGLWGDSSDNIPGCPGVGEKRAKELISAYDSIDGIYEHLDELKGKMKEKFADNKDLVMLSRKLATIVTDAPIDLTLDDIKLRDPNWGDLEDLFRELEVRGLSDRIKTALGMAPPPTAKSAKKNDQPTLFDFAASQEAASDNATTGKPALPETYTTIADYPHTFTLLKTADEVDELCQKLLTADAFCFDTETTSVEASSSAEIVGFSVSIKPGEAWFVRTPRDEEGARQLLSHIAPAFESDKSLKIGQNMKFDVMVLKRYGIEVHGPWFDTMIAHFLLHPSRRHNMDAMAEDILAYRPVPIENLIGSGAKQKQMTDVADDAILEYAAEDAEVTLRLYEALAPQVEADEDIRKLFHEIEMPMVPVLAEMEMAGVALDTKALDNYATFLRERISEVEKRIYDAAGETFNVASPKQVGDILFEKLKIDPAAKKTKTGGYVTNEETLQKLAHSNPIVADILTFRGLTKLLGTYVEALPKLVSRRTGRIHTSFNQTVVVTGRLSSSGPNLQNIPVRDEDGKRVRECFVASPGCKIVSADYSQVELRIMAHFSQDEHLLRAFRQGEDIHSATAAKVFGVPITEVTTEQRRRAKTANFGIIYGISAFGLSERLDIPRKEAKELIDEYFASFPGVKAYMDKCVADARQTGVVKTLYGRRRELPDINSRNQTVRGVAERNAINAPIQGTAADIIKIAMINVSRAIKEQNLRSKMILQVHDELVFEVPEEEVETLSALVKEQMENAAHLSVPLTAEVGVGDNWLQAH